MSPVLAVSQQQKVGMAVAVVMIAGWVLYLAFMAKRTYTPGTEIEEAPNRRPYFNDESMEGLRLETAQKWLLALVALVAVALPAYWLREPFRQKGGGTDRGAKYFDDQAVERGKRYFQASPGNPPTPREPHYGCENCHGAKGIGGVTTYTLSDPVNPSAPARQVQWNCPPLNTVLLRFRPEEVKGIITYGRAGTPMPPWGVAGGGALNEQQVDDLVSYLQTIQLKPQKVQEDNLREFGTDGLKLFDGFCARCHTQGFSYGEPGPRGAGAFGPNITGGETLRQFPNPEKHVEWVEKTAEFGKQYGERGVSKGVMPHFGEILTPDQIKAIVDYERTL